MPITAEARGKTFTFPDGTTEAQMGEAIDEYFSEQEPSVIDDSLRALQGTAKQALGVGENIASLASSMALQPVAGVAGAIQSINPWADEGSGAEAVQAVQDLAYQPRSEAGQDIQQGLGEAFGAAGELVSENITQPLGIDDLGGKTLEATGSPLLATVVDIMPELATEVLPATAIGGKIIKSGRTVRRKLADRIRQGDVNTGTIAKTLDAQGELVKNPNMKRAIDLMGKDEAAYNTAINFEKMNSQTKRQVNKMLDIINDNKLSGDPVKIMENRPANVVGQSLAKRINELDKVKKDASKSIGRIINGDKGSVRVGISQARDDFIDALDQADVDVNVKDGRISTDYTNTLTNVEDVISKKKLDNILNRINDGTISAKEAHNMKRQLREMVSYDPAKPGAVRVSKEIENAVKDLSTALGNSVSDSIPAYAKANQVFSESIEALQKADRALGNKLMIGDKLAEPKLGAMAKRIGTNLASKEDVFDLIDSVDDALAKRGITKYNDDIRRQVAVLADLEKIFKVESAQAPFGFQSRIAQAAIEGSPTNTALNIALDKFRSMNAMEFEDKMRALRALSKVEN